MEATDRDYFAAEPAITERLKVALATVVPSANFFTPFGIAEMLEASQPSPAIHVIYGGDALVSGTTSNKEGQMIGQRWMVILAVRCASAQLARTSDVRVMAGAIIPKLLNALQGWAPVPWMRPLGRMSGPSAGYSSAFAYFPFMFEGRIVT